MAHQISTSIQINATPADIWKVFIDFEQYSTWNPLIKSIKGEVKLNGKLTVMLDNMTFKPRVKSLVQHQEFIWLGHLLVPGVFDGRHSYVLQDNNDGTTTFIHSEKFTGLLIPFMKKKLDTEVKAKFEAMNIALKDRVESAINPLNETH